MQKEDRRKDSSSWNRRVGKVATVPLLLAAGMIVLLLFWKPWVQKEPQASDWELQRAVTPAPELSKAPFTSELTRAPGLSLTPGPTPSQTPTLALTPGPTPSQTPTLALTPGPTPSQASTPTPTPTPTLTPTPSPTPTPAIVLELPVKAALLMDATTGEVLYGHRAYEQITPASVTKLMTVLLALEHGVMEDVLTVTDTALDVGNTSAVMCGFQSGDTVTLYDMLHGMLLSSGNDAAQIVAEYISGSVSEFVKLMNERATELGMTQTNFANPHGLPNDEQLTSAYDISLVMRELLCYREFFEISSKTAYTAQYKNAAGKQVLLTFRNTNQFMAGKYELTDGIEILAGKTGTTNKAGKCLVLFVRAEDGKTYFAEMFGAETLDDLYFFMNRLLDAIPRE